MELGYDKNGSLGSFVPQYNGNIGGTLWKSAGDNEIRKYDFNYDVVNRLTGATFNQYVSGSGSSAVFNTTSSGLDFSVSALTYDANGNILSQDQKGWKLGGSLPVDELRYKYLPNSNKLQNVIDLQNVETTKVGDFRSSNRYATTLGAAKTLSNADNYYDYSYDVNGNLTKDLNKDIENPTGGNGIEYNHLNLPSKIFVRKNDGSEKGSIEYIYDAAGNKLNALVGVL